MMDESELIDPRPSAMIAAAPDMLNALKLAQVEIGASGKWMADGWEEACEAIADAIAKAEGK